MGQVNRNGNDTEIGVLYLDVVDYTAGTGATTYTTTSPGPLKGLMLVNDSTGDLTVTVNGITVTVKANETFIDRFQYFTTVQIAGAGAWRLWLYQ